MVLISKNFDFCTEEMKGDLENRVTILADVCDFSIDYGVKSIK